MKNLLATLQILLVLLSLALPMQPAYTFTNSGDLTHIRESSKIANIVDGFPDDYREQCVLVYGKLQALFGAPIYETIDYENQYCYVLQATLGGNAPCYLSVYGGPSGPAIGGDPTDPAAHAAAQALIALLQTATPADYAYEGYYPDIPVHITEGIQNGQPYRHDERITDPDEIQRILDEVYNW